MSVLTDAVKEWENQTARKEMAKVPVIQDLARQALIKKIKMIVHTVTNYLGVTTQYPKLARFVMKEMEDPILAAHREKLTTGYGMYLSSFSAWGLTEAVYTYIREGNLKKIRMRQIKAFMLDKSADAGHKEQMSLFCRSTSPNGDIEIDFIVGSRGRG